MVTPGKGLKTVFILNQNFENRKIDSEAPKRIFLIENWIFCIKISIFHLGKNLENKILEFDGYQL